MVHPRHDRSSAPLRTIALRTIARAGPALTVGPGRLQESVKGTKRHRLKP